MIKVTENELKSVLKDFNNKSIYIYFNGIISVRNTIYKSKIKYDNKANMLTIYDKIREDIIKIDMNMVYQVLVNKEHTVLEIRVDNEEILRLEL